MKTCFIVIHYNDPESTIQLIHQIQNYQILDKIIIVDNHSSQEALAKIKKLSSKKIEIIENEINHGFAKAINIGSKQAIKELGDCNLILSNSDIILTKEEDLKQLIVLLQPKDIGVVAPTILEQGQKNRGWKNPSPMLDSFLNLIYIHRLIRKKYIFYPESHYAKEESMVEVVSGCFFLMKSQTLQQIHYLDENTFLYYEENILAKKIQNIGKKILVSNTISIIHNHSVSIDKNLKKIKKLKLQKQSQYYFQTHYNQANLLEKGLLKLTAFTSRMILTVVYAFKDWLKK